MTASLHPELDLTVPRIIRVPRSAVWNAWIDPGRHPSDASFVTAAIAMKDHPDGTEYTATERP